MRQYLDLAKRVLTEGSYKPNRTGVDTIARFSESYRVDLSGGFPLLTTKEFTRGRQKSLFHELVWYFSGQHHIRDFRTKSKIWDSWADDGGNLQTGYGRFWGRFPMPSDGAKLPGEAWLDGNSPFVNDEGNDVLTVDQLKYVIHKLRADPNSRRMVVTAWHPGNAIASKLPPCHYTFTFSVLNGKLNTHLNQRSGDTALGIPFNLAGYSAITLAVCEMTGLEPGEFTHHIVDSHVYIGKHGERGEFYRSNLDELKDAVRSAQQPEDYLRIASWIESQAPKEAKEGLDHVPGLLRQLAREPKTLPRLVFDPRVKRLEDLKDLRFEDFIVVGYQAHPKIDFAVAE